MTVEQKKQAFEKLGIILREAGETKDVKTSDPYVQNLKDLASTVYTYNAWFTEENCLYAYRSLGNALTQANLDIWLSKYELKTPAPKNIGLIMAGNIPLVGFHDMLCILMSGHNLIAKASSEDKHLPKLIAAILIALEPGFKEKIHFAEGQLKTIDGIIATGSNNSSRYFEYYFGKYPHIIRKNRNSIAVLTGAETDEELKLLGDDIFQYFGLGCRNVSKVFVPRGYNFDFIFKAIFNKQTLLQHNKYANNYEYNKTVYLMHGYNLLENGFLLLKEDIGLASPVAVLYYEYYDTETELNERLHMDAPHIQCTVSKLKSIKHPCAFGQTQQPQLWDYADGIDTLKFLQDSW